MHGPLRMVVSSNGKTLDAVSLVRGLQQYIYVYCKTACTVLRPFARSWALGCTQAVCRHFWWQKLCHEHSHGMWTTAVFGLKAASHAAHKIRIVLCVSYCAAIFHIVKPKMHCMIKHLGEKIIYFWEQFQKNAPLKELFPPSPPPFSGLELMCKNPNWSITINNSTCWKLVFKKIGIGRHKI